MPFSAAGRSQRSFRHAAAPNLTPFFSGFYTTSPWNTGRALDGIGCFCESWRPDLVGDPARAALGISSSTLLRMRFRLMASLAT